MSTPRSLRSTAGFFLVFVVLAGATAYRIAAHELNFVTGLLFLGAFWALWFLVAEALTDLFRGSRNTRNNLRLLLSSSALATLALELFLRFGLGTYTNYHELNGGRNYHSVVTYANRSWFHVHQPNTEVTGVNREFSHFRKTNSLGLAEREIGPEKQPREFRIVALGDSYTEGLGTAYDSTWVKVVERELAQRLPDRPITTINAGVSGADIFSGYVLLREKLLALHPDLVIVAVNHSDVADITIRGGMERFRPDGSLKVQRTEPVWDPLYGISHIVRHLVHDVFGYNWLLVSPREAKTADQDAVIQIRQAMGLLASLAREHRVKLLFAFHPQEFEVRDGGYDPPALEWLAHQSWQSEGAHVIDLRELFQAGGSITRDNSSAFFWATDLHMNARGYAVMGAAIAERIMALGLLEEPRRQAGSR